MSTSLVTLVPALQSLPPYVFAALDDLKAAARAGGATLVDLGIGSPDLPMAAGIVDELSRAAHAPGAGGYPPFRGVPRYLDAIAGFMADRFGVTVSPLEQCLALSGAKEGIAQLLMATCGPGDVVLIPDIYYPVYARSAWLGGAEVRWMPVRADRNFVVDFDAIPEDDARRARVLIVNYPNNPTGARVDLEFYQRAVEFARRNNMLLVSDVAYSELTFEGEPAPSALQADPACEVTVEFHSCSKTFSMAGLRIGFVTGNREAIDAIAAYRTNVGYGTPTAVQQAAGYALEHHRDLVPPKVAAYRKRRDAMVAAFSAAGWEVQVPTATMYLWLPVPEGIDDWRWVQTLIDEDGIVVTPGVAFGEGGAGWFRISLVRDTETLARAATQIARRRAQLLGALSP